MTPLCLARVGVKRAAADQVLEAVALRGLGAGLRGDQPLGGKCRGQTL